MAVKSSNCKVLEDPETQSPQSRPIAGHAGAARRRKTGTGQRWYSVFCSQSLVIFCTRQTVDSTKSLLDQHIHRNRPVRSAWERNARIFRHLWRYMIAVRRDIARSHILMWFFSFLLAMSCLLQNRKHIGLYSSNELMEKRNKKKLRPYFLCKNVRRYLHEHCHKETSNKLRKCVATFISFLFAACRYWCGNWDLGWESASLTCQCLIHSWLCYIIYCATVAMWVRAFVLARENRLYATACWTTTSEYMRLD